MLYTSIPNLRPGMVIAEKIVSADGRVLLAPDITLTSTNIAWLKSHKLSSVYIKNSCYTSTPMFSHQALAATKQAMSALVKNKLDSEGETRTIHFDNTRKMESIADVIMRNPIVLLHLTDIYNYDYPTFVHSVNVFLLSIMMGIKMGYTRSNMWELALGSILHDLGKVLVTPGILNKQERLDPDEWVMIQGHVMAGFEILRSHSKYIPLEAALIALHHHENYDGSGYTKGIVGARIHEYAAITAVADVYDAISTDRSYRPGMSLYEAYQFMINARGVRLNPDIVDLFLKNIAPYPFRHAVKRYPLVCCTIHNNLT
ncbi:MAG: HD domain-containing protein [Negativicutes bacterium]|nr:HD domain-containing protein [Negativicutes bacterium]